MFFKYYFVFFPFNIQLSPSAPLLISLLPKDLKLNESLGLHRGNTVNTKDQHALAIVNLGFSRASTKSGIVDIFVFCFTEMSKFEIFSNLRRPRSDLLNPKFGSQKSALL